MKKIIWIVIVLVVVGAAGLLAYRSLRPEATNKIMVSGNIELTEVNIAFKTAGKLIERTVDEGDAVKKGQIIARLDRDQLIAQRERQAADIAAAEGQLAQAVTSLEWERANSAGDIEQAQADLSSAESRLAELKNGSRPQEKQESKAAVDQAQSELDRARNDWERAQTLYKNDDISTEQYDQYRNRWQSSDASLKQAQERYALVQAGPRDEVIRAAEGQVAKARGAVKVAQSATLEIKRREQDVATRRDQITSAKAGSCAHRFAARRHYRVFARGWRGAGEIGRRGRGAGRGHHHSHYWRYRPPVATRLHPGTGPRAREGRRQGQGDHRLV